MLSRGIGQADLYVVLLDQDMRLSFVSASAARVLRSTVEQLVGSNLNELEMLPEKLRRSIEPVILAARVSGEPRRGDALTDLFGRRFYLQYEILPIREGGEDRGALALVTNVSEQRRYQRLLEALDRINRAINAPHEERDILATVTPLIQHVLEEDLLVIIIRDGEGWRGAHTFPGLPVRIEDLRLHPESVRLTELIVREGRSIRIADATTEPGLDPEFVAKWSIRSMMGVPLRVRGSIEGSIGFLRTRPLPFSDRCVEFAEKLAAAVSLALANSRDFNELAGSERVKTSLLHDLGRERDLIRGLLEASTVAMAIFEGRDPRLVLYNQAFREIFLPQHADGKMEETEAIELLREVAFEEDDGLLERLLREGKPVTDLNLSRHLSGGQEVHLKLTVVPLLTEETPRFLIAAANVTDLVQDGKRKDELAKREESGRKRLHAILEALPVAVMVVDEAGRLVESNHRRDQIWGRGVSSDTLPEGMSRFKGRSAHTGLRVAGRDWPIYRALDKGEVVNGEMIDIQRLDGTPATMMVSAAPLNDDSGKRIGAVGVLQDITHHRQLEQEALEAKGNAEFYLELLTHDISNIHTVISGHIQLAMGADKERREKALSSALRAVSDGQSLIDTLRKIQRVEAQEDRHGPVDLGFLLEEVRDDYQKAGQTVHYDLVLHRMVMASPLIKDIFVNLVDNAVKHSPEGVEVDIRLLRVFEGAKEQQKVIVEDNGPGIPDDMKSKVFQRGMRGQTRASGKGLGLYLIKRLVEEFGGKVWVEDRVPGDHTKGARFVVMLPSAGKEQSDRFPDGQT